MRTSASASTLAGRVETHVDSACGMATTKMVLGLYEDAALRTAKFCSGAQQCGPGRSRGRSCQSALNNGVAPHHDVRFH